MERRNNQTNKLIMWFFILVDVLLLNMIIFVFGKWHGDVEAWDWSRRHMFFVISNAALLASEWKFHTNIHLRLVSAGDVLRDIFLLTATQMMIAYILMRHVMYWMASGWVVLHLGISFFVLLVVLRLLERNLVKKVRRLGFNTRTVTLVGSDKKLEKVYEQLVGDPTTGYTVQGYYADEGTEGLKIPRTGTVADLLESDAVNLGDEMYVCMSRKEGETIKALSELCDRQVTKFYYIPVSLESIGLNLRREFINDLEVWTTHESALESPLNKAVKRLFDVMVSLVSLVLTGLAFPFICFIVKKQSPGPIFFKQLRTGLDGRDFVCYKFRSMHVNARSDELQATKNDPRKFPFGSFMRRTNIDEMPQFWNVLIGDMSVVGPRPHMLKHTDIYSQQIAEYMVRHFVKPGITGWAQVTGFRGETKELWQMEERVRRDIWYLEHWTIWFDMRIVWMTVKNVFKRDENAY